MSDPVSMRRPGAPAGIYIHIPFCERLCPYCDFAVAVRREIPHRAYADAVLSELARRVDDGELAGRTISTVYLGGGTPSLLCPDELGRLLAAVRSLGVEPGAEWTIEANPASVDADRLERWRAEGVTRVSLGVQSFDDDYLSRLGRNHDGAMARDAYESLLAAGFATSLDLIFAGPQHDMSTWERDLELLATLSDLHHVSAYHLTVEPRTAFARRWDEGTLELPDDEAAVEMLVRLRQVCGELGVEQYEVSSYAAEGRRSRHNTHYWTGSEYLGLGVGAHGLRIEAGRVVRTANDRRLKRYLANPTEVRAEEEIDARTHLGERLFTGLRTAEGIELGALQKQFSGQIGASVFDEIVAALERIEELGWVRRTEERYVPTPDGYLFADASAQIVWEALAA